MLTLSKERLTNESIPLSTGWLLSSCAEAKGKQDLWLRQKPEMLAALREQAIIQSAESSNRIEGVTIAADRLRPVIIGKSKPRDRSEEELAGYRKALDWIFTRKRQVRMDPKVILHLHSMAQGGFSGDAGKWKSKDNEIIEILPNDERKIRFKPTSAKATPGNISQLCQNYLEAITDERIPPLITVATFVFDLLCIHPFRDGNGRVSRLVTTMLLQQHGFSVCRFISLERLVEDNKEDYYWILKDCSTGWHQGKNEILPWWNYFLTILRRAYQKLEQKVEMSSARPAKSELIRQTIFEQVGPFTLAELSAQFPAASRQLIKKILGQMKKNGKITLTGRGRGAHWEVTSGMGKKK